MIDRSKQRLSSLSCSSVRNVVARLSLANTDRMRELLGGRAEESCGLEDRGKAFLVAVTETVERVAVACGVDVKVNPSISITQQGEPGISIYGRERNKLWRRKGRGWGMRTRTTVWQCQRRAQRGSACRPSGQSSALPCRSWPLSRLRRSP